MDAFLAIASRREVRDYAPTPISAEAETRILDAGRLSGSSQNTQEWQFVVVSDRDALAATVWVPENVSTSALSIAIVGGRPFDVGRCAQNMMLAAWNDGIGSCPNGIKDAEEAERICGGPVSIILSFGYPATPRNPESRTAGEWSAHAKRKPLDELVRRV